MTTPNPTGDALIESLAKVMYDSIDSMTYRGEWDEYPTVVDGDVDFRALARLARTEVELTVMEVVTRAIMSAEPVEGFVPERREDKAAWRYGKDCALVAAREALFHWQAHAKA